MNIRPRMSTVIDSSSISVGSTCVGVASIKARQMSPTVLLTVREPHRGLRGACSSGRLTSTVELADVGTA